MKKTTKSRKKKRATKPKKQSPSAAALQSRIHKLERENIRLDRQVFNLQQKLVKMEAAYEKQIAELKARKPPPITEEERVALLRRHEEALAANKASDEAVMPTEPPEL